MSTQAPAGFVDSRDHLAAELEWLDLAIRQALSRRPGHATDAFAQLRGLVLTEEEIQGLACSPGSHEAASDHAEELTRLDETLMRRREASLESGVELTLPYLSTRFRLSRFEERCLLVALAPELDSRYDKLYAFLHDDVTRKRPSIDLLWELTGAAWSDRVATMPMFSPHAPLLRYRLVELSATDREAPVPLRARTLKLDDRIAGFLLGSRTPDSLLPRSIQLTLPDGRDSAICASEMQERVCAMVRAHFLTDAPRQHAALFHVTGRYGSDREALAHAAARALDLPVLTADAERLKASGAEALWRVAREAFLQPAVLCVQNFDALLASECSEQRASLLEGVQVFGLLCFLVGHKRWTPEGHRSDLVYVALHRDVPDDGARHELWRSLADESDCIDVTDTRTLAGMFRFTPGQMRDALQDARALAKWRSPESPLVNDADLYQACRAQSNPKLAGLARRIEARYGWEDIVLPDSVKEQLRDVCDQARHRSVVLGDWGFGAKHSLGNGTSVLFSGPPGTGKTMGAEVLARTLNLDLFKIDLSQVVSKYIGETEKHLDRLFDAAEQGNAILFFDEADALFGKRSEVRDSHDRYANLEISYLLQRAEEYSGIAILATNLRKHFDVAFLRRLQAIIEFPFPDATYRERIWGVTFPEATPLAEDVRFAELARRIRLPGASIKAIGLAAAYLAASDGGVVSLGHIERATVREYTKLGQTWRDAVLVQEAGR